jgi:hypothetical protein
MNKILLILNLFFLTISVNAQELNCRVIVNADRINGNKQVFKTLEKSLTEFINNSNWTGEDFKKQERIECSMILTILKEDGKAYQGNIQIQSTRPVYNSVYTTPVFNFQDKNLNFSYTEFEPLRFNENAFQSDLISIVSYYVYLVLGLDADTFEKYGGSKYFEKCQTIMSQVENQNDKTGWTSNSHKINRYNLLKELQSSANADYRKAFYNYHRKGLDLMESKKKEAKNTIYDAVLSLNDVYRNNMTSYLLRVFMDAKVDELVQIFSDGPNVDVVKLKNVLNRISATNAHKWAEIK